jgi:transposase InsO family protein
VRLRPEHPNHVWSYDFVEDRTHDGRKYRMLNIIDEFTRECIAIQVNRRLKATEVIDVLSDLRSPTEFIGFMTVFSPIALRWIRKHAAAAKTLFKQVQQ